MVALTWLFELQGQYLIRHTHTRSRLASGGRALPLRGCGRDFKALHFLFPWGSSLIPWLVIFRFFWMLRRRSDADVLIAGNRGGARVHGHERARAIPQTHPSPPWILLRVIFAISVRWRSLPPDSCHAHSGSDRDLVAPRHDGCNRFLKSCCETNRRRFTLLFRVHEYSSRGGTGVSVFRQIISNNDSYEGLRNIILPWWLLILKMILMLTGALSSSSSVNRKIEVARAGHYEFPLMLCTFHSVKRTTTGNGPSSQQWRSNTIYYKYQG